MSSIIRIRIGDIVYSLCWNTTPATTPEPAKRVNYPSSSEGRRKLPPARRYQCYAALLPPHNTGSASPSVQPGSGIGDETVPGFARAQPGLQENFVPRTRRHAVRHARWNQDSLHHQRRGTAFVDDGAAGLRVDFAKLGPWQVEGHGCHQCPLEAFHRRG